LPPPWSGWLGATILTRGAAVGGVLGIGVNLLVARYLDADHPLVGSAVVILGVAPALLLARRHLWRPAGLGMASTFGLIPRPGGLRALALTVPVVVALGLIGDLILNLVADWQGSSVHWAEWFDEDLIQGSRAAIVGSLVASVIVAPIVEEIAFRGLLYGTLRRRWRPLPAALLTGLVFAAAHGYGIWGFASVLWSGFLWAWTYERTRSLLPGMLAHAANNLTTSIALLGLLRL
jgi:membrane protease YdiL (CAAX protease family)